MPQSKWYDLFEDLNNMSIFTPFFSLYEKFLNIKRYASFPFYIYPEAKGLNQGLMTKAINFIDHTIDSHESQHTGWEGYNHDMYTRARFVWRKFWLYSNDTMYNLFFFSSFSRAQQDQLASKMKILNIAFYTSMTLFHSFTFAIMCWALRMRSATKLATFGIGSLYYLYFKTSYQYGYILFDRLINSEAKRLGLGEFVQPAYTTRQRNIDY